MDGHMWPIHGLSKAKRILWGPEQNQLSWAYMKMLREESRCAKVYNVNPYVEVYQFEDNLYGLFNQNCDGMGDVWEYLIVGPEKAMLIDTAFGIGDIKGLCDELSGGKELIVVNTHIGPDHAFGNVRFDRVYCHELEYDSIKKRINPHAWDYMFDEDGKNIWLQFDKKDLPAYREYELIAVSNHHIFNLGEDYDVELIWMPGHAAGHSVFLDKKRRRLFAGDCVCSDVMGVGSGGRPGDEKGIYCTLEAYRNELKKLCERLEEFDYIFPGHFMVYLENHVMRSILVTLEDILKNPDDFTYKTEQIDKEGRRRIQYYKLVPGFSVISYNRERGVYMKSAEVVQ
ncbi:MAG: MBL fold metallo-hydrolase [Eubacteriales bacterium]|nr:MBL fold metallo-hydrolase [Eubacteriales bacterium]